MAIPSYTPATIEQMAKMSHEQLLSQYQSLADLLKETRGMNFERNPQIERDELARLIWEGQANNIKDVLAGSLMKWGETHPGVILTSGGQN